MAAGPGHEIPRAAHSRQASGLDAICRRRGGSVITDDTAHAPLALILDADASAVADLEKIAGACGFRVYAASSLDDAGLVLHTARPAIALLDLDTSSGESLEQLRHLHERAPGSPLVVMSPRTDPEAIQVALAHGASNVIKRPLAVDEARYVLERAYRAARAESDQPAPRDLAGARASELTFRARPGLLSKVIAFLTQELEEQFPGVEGPVSDIKLALYEAFANAMEHGNLNISFEQKTAAMEQPGGIQALINGRLEDPKLAARRVFVRAEYDRDGVDYIVRDEGDGFDIRKRLAEPMAETTALHGRGLKMIEFYMDRVMWNGRGNEMRMRKDIR